MDNTVMKKDRISAEEIQKEENRKSYRRASWIPPILCAAFALLLLLAYLLPLSVAKEYAMPLNGAPGFEAVERDMTETALGNIYQAAAEGLEDKKAEEPVRPEPVPADPDGALDALTEFDTYAMGLLIIALLSWLFGIAMIIVRSFVQDNGVLQKMTGVSCGLYLINFVWSGIAAWKIGQCFIVGTAVDEAGAELSVFAVKAGPAVIIALILSIAAFFAAVIVATWCNALVNSLKYALQQLVHALSQGILYGFLIIMAIIVLFPFYWMINSSLKTLTEYNRAVPTFWPEKVMLINYVNAFDTANLGRLFLNTCYVGIVSTLLSLVITILSAFAFARLEFKGKNLMFGALLATMMIPGELFTITNYQTVAQFTRIPALSWMGTQTFGVLIVPFLVSVFYIYLLRQNFMQIPNELYLAAKVDGTADIKYLCKVMIPLSLPTLISITILKMMGAWNSYIWPRLVANDDAHKLITNGLRGADFTDAAGYTDFPAQMAAVALVSIPLFLVFVFLRKYIMKGVSRSGIKG